MPSHSEIRRSGKSSGHVVIVLGNLLAIGLALYQRWDLRPMLLIYWAQSVIIGYFHFRRIQRMFPSARSVPVTELRAGELPSGDRNPAGIFAIQFGLAHAVYFVFILGMACGAFHFEGAYRSPWIPSRNDLLWLGSAALGFLGTHWFSYRQNLEADLQGRPGFGALMFLPYVRVVPMHLAIVMGLDLKVNWVGVVCFSLLKTGLDLLMHGIEHRLLRVRGNIRIEIRQ